MTRVAQNEAVFSRSVITFYISRPGLRQLRRFGSAELPARRSGLRVPTAGGRLDLLGREEDVSDPGFRIPEASSQTSDGRREGVELARLEGLPRLLLRDGDARVNLDADDGRVESGTRERLRGLRRLRAGAEIISIKSHNRTQRLLASQNG